MNKGVRLYTSNKMKGKMSRGLKVSAQLFFQKGKMIPVASAWPSNYAQAHVTPRPADHCTITGCSSTPPADPILYPFGTKIVTRFLEARRTLLRRLKMGYADKSVTCRTVLISYTALTLTLPSFKVRFPGPHHPDSLSSSNNVSSTYKFASG